MPRKGGKIVFAARRSDESQVVPRQIKALGNKAISMPHTQAVNRRPNFDPLSAPNFARRMTSRRTSPILPPWQAHTRSALYCSASGARAMPVVEITKAFGTHAEINSPIWPAVAEALGPLPDHSAGCSPLGPLTIRTSCVAQGSGLYSPNGTSSNFR